MRGHFWSQAEVDWLKKRWSEGISPPNIAAELSCRSPVGWTYSMPSVVQKAARLRLRPRRVDWNSAENTDLIRMCHENKPDSFIAEVLGLKPNQVRYRAETLIKYGMLKRRRASTRPASVDQPEYADA